MENKQPSDASNTPPSFIKKQVDFIRDIATNWDCDQDSHTYNTPCRKCEAIKLLKEMGEEIPDWAKPK